jgi:lysyl-tRNA synthetase class 2
VPPERRHPRFLRKPGVLEVETPILSMAGNTEPNIDSFHTDFSGHVDAGPRRRWLRTSPEYPLKRLLAAGIGDCYELGRVFRNGEAGGRHNPEFTMLEWYRVGWDHLRLIDETAELVRMALALVGRDAAPTTVTYRELFRQPSAWTRSTTTRPHCARPWPASPSMAMGCATTGSTCCSPIASSRRLR